MTSEEVIQFVNEEIIKPFGPPKTIVSDNAGYFTSGVLKSFMSSWKIDWKTVLAYAPMSNGRAERTVDTLKSVSKLVKKDSTDWESKLGQAMYECSRRSLESGT